MSPEQYQRVKDVFLAVYERPQVEHESAVAQMCADDPQLLGEVQSLLKSHRNAEEKAAKVEKSNGSHPPTEALLDEPKSPSPRTGSKASSHATRGHGSRGGVKSRFAPGQILAERFRIVSLIGVGGMGEVYRADDLTLDEPVALKFLPPMLASDPSWLERFYSEVRLAHQVTHPNVCRVFDIGNLDGERFISMEFVDGEDLASLIRRIGRLPHDKAVQIARQLCAGLAAAHDHGVLHRDLKPANIMLDGRGDVRITDFGISAPTEGAVDSGAGTPAYMAPELFGSGKASTASDIYSLGLVLYEIFSGKPAFAAHSMPEYAKLHRQTAPTQPSTLIREIDPLAERVILRCLEKDPSHRPASALAVSAALPGGDPLAAALAAGETPSPEMVAAAGDDRSIGLVKSCALLSVVIIGLIVCCLLANSAFLLPRFGLALAPPVLVNKCTEILKLAGYNSSNPRSSANGFSSDDLYSAYLQKTDQSADRWDKLADPRSGSTFFWYRQSSDYLVAKDDSTLGMVTFDDPARNEPGMRTVVTDVLGRLRGLEIVSKASSRFDPPVESPATHPPNWELLFGAADLQFADFKPIDPGIWSPPVYADHRFSWLGYFPENPNQTVRINAASLSGTPVFFEIVGPWKTPANLTGLNPFEDLRIGNAALQAALILLAMTSAIVLAWRNVRSGRGDWRGAEKLAIVFLLLGLAIWLLCASHVPDVYQEWRLFIRVLGFILVPGIFSWIFYLALEPHVRRIWPETIISWSRLLRGQWRDPLVASHVLTGFGAGALAAIVLELGNVIPMSLGHAAPVTSLAPVFRFLARDNPATPILHAMLEALYMGLLYLMTLVLLRLVLRRRLLAALGFIVLVTCNSIQWTDQYWVQWIVAPIVAALILLLLVRYGLVATMAGLCMLYVIREMPITSDMSVWYAWQTKVALGLLAIVAILSAMVAGGFTRRQMLNV